MRRKHLIGVVMTVALTGISAITSLAAGWVNTSQGWKFQKEDGTYESDNWVFNRNHWYFIGGDEVMKTGWIQRDNTWYYAASSGELQSGLMKINGNVYYFDGNSCQMLVGDRMIEGITYKFTENGVEGTAPYVYTEWDSKGNVIRGEKFAPTY